MTFSPCHSVLARKFRHKLIFHLSTGHKPVPITSGLGFFLTEPSPQFISLRMAARIPIIGRKERIDETNPVDSVFVFVGSTGFGRSPARKRPEDSQRPRYRFFAQRHHSRGDLPR